MLRLIAVTLLAVACTAAPQPTATPWPTTTPNGSPTGSPSANPTDSPMPEAPADGVEGLIGELAATGSTVSEGDEFYAAPLSNEGRHICLDGESINVYVFASPEEAQARAAMIDRRDPSNVGTAIIEWAGNPKFWLHGRLLVLYLGNDAAVIDSLVHVLGEPFASGQGRPPLRGDDGC